MAPRSIQVYEGPLHFGAICLAGVYQIHLSVMVIGCVRRLSHVSLELEHLSKLLMHRRKYKTFWIFHQGQ